MPKKDITFAALPDRHHETLIRLVKKEYNVVQQAFSYIDRDKHPDIHKLIDKRLSELDVLRMRTERTIKNKKDEERS